MIINVSFSSSHRSHIIIMGCFDDSDINVSFSRSHRSHIIIMGCFDDSDINVSFSRSHRSHIIIMGCLMIVTSMFLSPDLTDFTL